MLTDPWSFNLLKDNLNPSDQLTRSEISISPVTAFLVDFFYILCNPICNSKLGIEKVLDHTHFRDRQLGKFLS